MAVAVLLGGLGGGLPGATPLLGRAATAHAATAHAVTAQAATAHAATEQAAAQETYPVPASGSWAVTGHGYGHARGMGQWSAQGAALGGWSGEQIVDWAYPGTTGTWVGSPLLRVRLTALGGAAVTVRAPAGAGPLTVSPQSAQATTVASEYTLTSAGFGSIVDVSSADGVQVRLADGSWLWYRGLLRIDRAGGALTVTNHVDLTRYLYGVVPRESPAWFHPQALRAQAFAARSYALAVARPQNGFDICDTTACQVYGGRARVSAAGAVTSLETSATTAAVDSTAGWILSYQGAPAFTQFSASSGGWTRPGSTPYLVAQADPWSGTAPKDASHSWQATLEVAAVERSCPAGGRLTSLTVTSRDGRGEWGGRVSGARLACTTGSVDITSEAELRFEMKSSWWRPASGATSAPPIGDLNAARADAGTVTVTGWSADPDTPAVPTRVHVYVDGRYTAEATATGDRPDVAVVYPPLGSAHGYAVTVRAAAGPHTVCVWALDTGGLANAQLGCRTVTVAAGAASFGWLDTAAATGPGRLRVSGWAADPDAGAGAVPLTIRLGALSVAGTTGDARPDVAAAFPGFGTHAGFDRTLLVPAGDVAVCADAGDVGGGTPTGLGCRNVRVPGGPPSGWLDDAAAGPRSITTRGWAWDPDAGDSPITAHVYVDGASVATPADRPSPNLAGPHPATGAAHGFATTMPAQPGTHRVCAWAIDSGGSSHQGVGCRSVTVPTGNPFGYLDSVSAGTGEVRVVGWSADPDIAGAIPVHVYVGGTGTAAAADVTRPDVAAVFPGWGAGHGFDVRLPAPPGPATVCVFALNAAEGDANPMLGCRTVSVG